MKGVRGKKSTRAARVRRRGSILLYVVLAMPVLLGVAAFAVDWGRLQAAKQQLQTAADASVRYAALGLADGTAVSKAQSVAAGNQSDGRPLALAASDVEVGRWDAASRQFVPNGTPRDSVRVTVRRSVPLGMASMGGSRSVTLSASAVAQYAPPRYQVVGLDAINLGGSCLIQSYNSSSAPAPAPAAAATNGGLTIGGSSVVRTDVYHLPGKPVGSPTTGQIRTLASALSYPPAALPAASVNLGAVSKSGGTYTLNAGTYRASSVSFTSTVSVVINGDVSLYVTGPFTMTTSAMTSNRYPSQLKIYMVGGGLFSVSGSCRLAATLYAPQSGVQISGSTEFDGTLVARQIDLSTSSLIRADAAQAGGGGVSSVQ